jgi:tetratricopeptide (TPR) repeat protein
MGVRQSTDFFFISGRAYYDLGEYDKSAACFRQGLSIYPEDPNLRFYLGVVYDKAGLRTLAANELRKTIKIDPEMHEALNYLGYLYAEDGVNLEEAESLVRRALTLSPGNAAYMDSLGWVLYKKGEYEKAAEELSAAAESAADDATIREHLGDAYHKLKDLDRAGTEWEKALELDPARSEVTEKLKALKERAVRVN